MGVGKGEMREGGNFFNNNKIMRKKENEIFEFWF